VSDEKNLTKVRVELPNHWATGGESIWAANLGNGLYELRNTPFYAYDLNWGDVVQASADDPNVKPELVSVVKRSGHRTLRCFFKKHVSQEEALEYLDRNLKPLHVSYEGLNGFYFALNLAPEAREDDVRDVLEQMQDAQLIEYETCEARVAGSFDDRPKEPEGDG